MDRHHDLPVTQPLDYVQTSGQSPLIEHDVPGIVSKRLKPKEEPASNQAPLEENFVETMKGMVAGLIMAIFCLVVVMALAVIVEHVWPSPDILPLGNWSQQ